MRKKRTITKLTPPPPAKETPHRLLEKIFQEATLNMRNAQDEKAKAYWQGKKDGVRMAQALYAKDKTETSSYLRSQITSESGGVYHYRFTDTEYKVFEDTILK